MDDYIQFEPEEVITFEAADAPVPRSELYESMVGTVRQYLRSRTNEVFVHAQESLFEFVKDASGEDAQSDCFDSIQTLHRIKPAVCEEFEKIILGRIQKFW